MKNAKDLEQAVEKLRTGFSLPEGYAVRREHDGHESSARTARYKGREIEIVTTYQVRIDGLAMPIQLRVGNDGGVRCHALPNYTFSSALDLVKELIDASTGSEPDNELAGKGGGDANP